MALPGTYRVQVYNAHIAGMFTPGGDVWDEAKKITREVEADAILRASKFSPAPQNRVALFTSSTGRVLGGSDRIIDNHRRRIIPSPPYGVLGTVENQSSHAVYKHNGNGSPGSIIRPRRASYLAIPAGKWGPRRVSQVRAYAGEPWLREAANDVLLRYGLRLPPE